MENTRIIIFSLKNGLPLVHKYLYHSYTNADKDVNINIHELKRKTKHLCRFTSESVHRWESQIQVLKFSLVMNCIM